MPVHFQNQIKAHAKSNLRQEDEPLFQLFTLKMKKHSMGCKIHQLSNFAISILISSSSTKEM